MSPRSATRRSGLPLSDSARAGQAVFAQSGCKTCHSGPFYRDGRQHEVAAGRWVRTPTLRNLPLTPPYLADGSAPTLEAVLNSPFHARQRVLSPADVRRIAQFLKAIPLDTNSRTHRLPVMLPDIANAPPRRIGGHY